MQSTPRTTPEQASGDHSGAGSPISRRTLAKGLAWAAPTVVLAAPAPALAASTRDIVVGKTDCSKKSLFVNRIPFTVATVNGATLPAGTVFKVNYAGGSRTPTWDGALADNSNSVINPGNDTSIDGGRYGVITFTLRVPMPANTLWELNINMDIGASITGQYTILTVISPPGAQDADKNNNSASHEMYRGGCAN